MYVSHLDVQVREASTLAVAFSSTPPLCAAQLAAPQLDTDEASLTTLKSNLAKVFQEYPLGIDAECKGIRMTHAQDSMTNTTMV